MMQKTVIILYNTSWYIYNFRRNLIKAIFEAGYQVTTVAPVDDYTPKLEELGCNHIQVKMDSASKNPLRDIKLIFDLVYTFKKSKPTAILNYTAKPNIYGTIAGKLCGIPSINNIAGLGMGFVNESLLTKVLRILYRVSQKNAAKVFFQNPDDFNQFLQENIVTKRNCDLLPGSGVDLSCFKEEPIKLTNADKFTFLLVSRMLYSKGVMTLLNAGQILYDQGLRNFKIQLLGDLGVNNDDAISANEIDAWNQKAFVEYLGRTDNVKPFLANSHCVVLPSYYREGTPRSILEALAIGRPIITTNMPGCKETVIDLVNGYLIPPKDSHVLANKMKMLISQDAQSVSKMGAESRRLAESKFDEKIVINKYLTALENIK